MTIATSRRRLSHRSICSDRAESVDPPAPQSSAADFFDGATRTFWRNVEARGTGTQPPPLGRRPSRWSLPDEVRCCTGNYQYNKICFPFL